MSRQRRSAPQSDSFVPRLLGMLLMMALCAILFYFGMRFLQGIHAENEWAKQRAQDTPVQQHKPKQPEKPAQRIDYAFYRALSGDKPVVIGKNGVESPRSSAGESVTGANYRVQVGAFRQKEQADRMRAQMILHDYPVMIVQSSGFYLVQVGPYQKKETAQRIQQRLKRDGVDTLLKSYVN